jgi:DNA-directed RNA polymerase subunit RPC12/RpoP
VGFLGGFFWVGFFGFFLGGFFNANPAHRPSKKELEQGYMTFYTSCRPKFMCLNCGKFFATIESVNIHLMVHRQDTMYKCGACEKVFAHRHLYEGHLRTAHPGRAVCPRCRAVFPSHVALASHSATCNSSNNNNTQSSAPIQITPRLYNNNNSSSGSNNNSLSLAAAPTTEASVLGKKKTKANRPPPKLILISTDTTEYRRLEGSDHIIIQKQPPPPTATAEKVSSQSAAADPLAESPVAAVAGSVARKPISIAPKPMESLLSEEAKKILHSSAPRYE